VFPKTTGKSPKPTAEIKSEPSSKQLCSSVQKKGTSSVSNVLKNKSSLSSSSDEEEPAPTKLAVEKIASTSVGGKRKRRRGGSSSSSDVAHKSDDEISPKANASKSKMGVQDRNKNYAINTLFRPACKKEKVESPSVAERDGGKGGGSTSAGSSSGGKGGVVKPLSTPAATKKDTKGKRSGGKNPVPNGETAKLGSSVETKSSGATIGAVAKKRDSAGKEKDAGKFQPPAPVQPGKRQLQKNSSSGGKKTPSSGSSTRGPSPVAAHAGRAKEELLGKSSPILSSLIVQIPLTKLPAKSRGSLGIPQLLVLPALKSEKEEKLLSVPSGGSGGGSHSSISSEPVKSRVLPTQGRVGSSSDHSNNGSNIVQNNIASPIEPECPNSSLVNLNRKKSKKKGRVSPKKSKTKRKPDSHSTVCSFTFYLFFIQPLMSFMWWK